MKNIKEKNIRRKIMKKHIKYMGLVFILVYITACTTASQNRITTLNKPVSMALFDKTEMLVGDSRVIEVLFKEEKNLYDDGFETVKDREIQWSVDTEGIITFDMYGRIEAVKAGKVALTVHSTTHPEWTDTKFIQVVSKPTIKTVKKSIVDYRKPAATQELGLQKFVDRYTLEDFESSQDIPDYVKTTFQEGNTANISVENGNITWEIVDFVDESGDTYVLRTDVSLEDEDGNKLQYFMGKRYLPGEGKSAQKIISDKANGVWVLGNASDTPYVVHIRMEHISWDEKAKILNEQTDELVNRMGMVSDSSFNNGNLVKVIADNDGLWTSMYDVGELMHYAVLKRENNVSKETLAKVRARALKSLKAVLLLANISGREKTIDAKLRYLTSIRIGDGNKNSTEYLKKGAAYAVDDFSGAPSDRKTYTGIQANTTMEHEDYNGYIGGAYKYSLEGIHKEDWITEGEGASSKRVLSGFIARTIAIPEVEDVPYDDGIFFQRNKVKNGKTQVISEANRLYDFEENEQPLLDIGNKPLPKELMSVLNYKGKQYTVDDVAYKGDTSSDEIIGHLFLWKVAYDILDDKDPEEHALKEILVDTVRGFARHMISNQYTLVDATGQGTTWGKTSRAYFNNDFTFEDSPVNALVVLSAFKVASYVTGEKKFQDEYDLLVYHPSFRYADLAAQYLDRLYWISNNENYDRNGIHQQFDKDQKISDVERKRHAIYIANKSDEEMAMLAYYLLFQMEKDKDLLDTYKKGMNGWWNSISRSKNPLFYYIYQLAYPNTPKKDSYGNDVIESSAWQLTRFPMDFRTRGAFFYGSRPDVMKGVGSFSVNPNTVLGQRMSKYDAQDATHDINTKISPDYDPNNIYEFKVLPQDERYMHKYNGTFFYAIDWDGSNNIEGSTTYSLPYWLGRYHNMLDK